MLHPFMPFVTEAIWQELPKEIKQNEQDILMVAKWPL
jgi:valyl-tRNA synthetase